MVSILGNKTPSEKEVRVLRLTFNRGHSLSARVPSPSPSPALPQSDPTTDGVHSRLYKLWLSENWKPKKLQLSQEDMALWYRAVMNRDTMTQGAVSKALKSFKIENGDLILDGVTKFGKDNYINNEQKKYLQLPTSEHNIRVVPINIVLELIAEKKNNPNLFDEFKKEFGEETKRLRAKGHLDGIIYTDHYYNGKGEGDDDDDDDDDSVTNNIIDINHNKIKSDITSDSKATRKRKRSEEDEENADLNIYLHERLGRVIGRVTVGLEYKKWKKEVEALDGVWGTEKLEFMDAAFGYLSRRWNGWNRRVVAKLVEKSAFWDQYVCGDGVYGRPIVF